MKQGMIGILGGVLLMILSTLVLAEPPIHLSPSDIVGGMVGGLSPSNAPIRLQADCSADLEKCWKARGLNKENNEQVMDACWRETKICPKVCRDRYFAQRKAGIKAYEADDKVLFGEPSCIPGLDKVVHSVPKKLNDSTLRVSVTVAGKAADARIDVIPLDAQGRDVKRTTDGFVTADGLRYSMQSDQAVLPGTTVISLPAGQYRLRVMSPDRNYHPQQKFQSYQAFPKQLEQVSIKAAQTLEKVYTFGMGRLDLKARNEDGIPVVATVELRCWDRPDYVLHQTKLPLDTPLIAGKYRLVVTAIGSRSPKAFNIEIKDRKTISKTIMFDGRSA